MNQSYKTLIKYHSRNNDVETPGNNQLEKVKKRSQAVSSRLGQNHDETFLPAKSIFICDSQPRPWHSLKRSWLGRYSEEPWKRSVMGRYLKEPWSHKRRPWEMLVSSLTWRTRAIWEGKWFFCNFWKGLVRLNIPTTDHALNFMVTRKLNW